MQAVEEAGRQALDELRQLLGVLRPEVDEAIRDPQPGIADLPRLAERVRAAGPTLALAVDAPADGLPAAVELSAHRIVQEALTNVLKHAGNDAHVTVAVTAGTDEVLVDVRDDGGGTGSRRPPVDVTAGHGIIGMHERAALLGGSLAAGPTGDGGFRVTARLPTRPRADRGRQEHP